MALQVQGFVAALDEERDLAGDHPPVQSLWAVADEQAELVSLDMCDQYVGAGFGEEGRQVDHGVTFAVAEGGGRAVAPRLSRYAAIRGCRATQIRRIPVSRPRSG